MVGTEKDELSDEEIARRRDAALLRALNTPHKRQAEMKIGRYKAGAGASAEASKKKSHRENR